MRPRVSSVPGPQSKKIIDQLRTLNGGFFSVYPFVHAHTGSGCYFSDVDGNVFLDFASQVAANPLGYNHPVHLRVLKQYTKTPIKYAGQDFPIPEHLALLKTLLRTTPAPLNAAFLSNSGAEAVENALKIALHNQPTARYGVSFMSAFHGRSLGALSCTDTKAIYKKDFWTFPMQRLPFSADAPVALERLLTQEGDASNVGFVIVEPIQGEGGYRIADPSWFSRVRQICKKNHIPFIADEVQCGMGRTGTWWAFEQMGITPDIFSSAKALQVGATVAARKIFPESGAISCTWGGGHTLDLALGVATLATIQQEKLLTANKKNGALLLRGLQELAVQYPILQHARGLGLMVAFDLPSTAMRNDVVMQLLKSGIVVLGCGPQSIRLIPPYIVTQKEIDLFLAHLEDALRLCSRKEFSHRGHICDFVHCGNRVR